MFSNSLVASIDCHRDGDAVWVVDMAPNRQRREMYHRARALMTT